MWEKSTEYDSTKKAFVCIECGYINKVSAKTGRCMYCGAPYRWYIKNDPDKCPNCGGGCNMAGRGRKPKTSKEELINLLKKAEVQIVGLDMSDIKKTDIVLIKIAPPVDPRVQAFFEEKTKAGFLEPMQ